MYIYILFNICKDWMKGWNLKVQYLKLKKKSLDRITSKWEIGGKYQEKVLAVETTQNTVGRIKRCKKINNVLK